MQKLLSFIIALYNTEEYIGRCLDSLLNQDMPKEKYDIIVVNDGSTDNGKEIVLEYQKRYENIILINQQNLGPSAARNTGLMYVNSKYIWFVDSDDWIAKNCLSILLKVMSKYSLNALCVAPSYSFNDDFVHIFDEEKDLGEVLHGKDFLARGQYYIAPWCYIYDFELLDKNNIRFKPGVLYEDEEITPRILYYAEKVMFLKNLSVYSYFIRADSICGALSEKHLFDKLIVSESLISFANDRVSSEDFFVKKELYRKVYHMFISGLHELTENDFDFELFRKYMILAKDRGIRPVKYSGNKFKEKFVVSFINKAPFIYYSLRKFYVSVLNKVLLIYC